MCVALQVPELPADPRFQDNRLRIANNHLLDPLLARAVENFTLDALMEKFIECEAAAAPVSNVAQIFEDPHFEARENLVTVFDEELGAPIRFQNVAGKLSATPGGVRHAGPILGSSNREILVGELGFAEAELGLDAKTEKMKAS
jgi:crotonobetainyl-CoA:carnitine CoA-transferase CaiB-like acyl-CoA transferase